MSTTAALVGGVILLKAVLIGVLVAQRRRSSRSEDKAREEQRQLVHLARVAVVGELSGGLAHELNQPLTVILSNAQAAQQALARDRVDVAELREILDDIVAADKRAEVIITRLRRLLKREELTLRRVGLAPLLEEVLSLVRSNLSAHCVQLEAHIADDLPDVLGDAVQIQQVLLNLLLNACDALSDAAPEDRRIELEAAREPEGRLVHVRVRDHGPGIDSDGLERVFDAFFTTKPNGLGLGLAICKQIVTAHGGRLWATQNGGRGAAFHMTLPIFKG
jgi:C4-dicarboxylate-specific signal transduction histidine kinase